MKIHCNAVRCCWPVGSHCFAAGRLRNWVALVQIEWLSIVDRSHYSSHCLSAELWQAVSSQRCAADDEHEVGIEKGPFRRIDGQA